MLLFYSLGIKAWSLFNGATQTMMKGTTLNVAVNRTQTMPAPFDGQVDMDCDRTPEYDDYEPCYPHLLPSGQAEAERRLAEMACIGREKLTALDQDTFLRAWWALHWLHPGLHPG